MQHDRPGSQPERGGERNSGAGAADMVAQIRFLEDEVALLRRKLTESPRHVRLLEQRLADASTRVSQLTERNAKLVETLRDARSQLMALREEVDRLAQPPSGYGVFLARHEDSTVDVFTAGRRMRVAVSPAVEGAELQLGQTVRLNEALTVVQGGSFERTGEVVTLREMLGIEGEQTSRRALVVGHADEERVVWLAEPLAEFPLKAGDSLLVDSKAGYAYERVPKAEVEDLVLEEVPDVDYSDIGGLSRQIEQIRDAVELPFLHAELFHEYKLRPPKGVLLYGPPGCGKTLIAKAVANSLAKQVAASKGNDDGQAKSYFLNIKGPELLNKFVGETERHIRLIFQRAREKASEGTPVIVFFDEMDSIFRTRGSGVSSDVETTIVPQLLSEIDGVEGLENVIVIGASNREDMIDPAILRPGRLDVKIKIERPDAEAARDIFSKYLLADLPIHDDDLTEFAGDKSACIDAMIQHTVERMYAETEENRFLEVTYANGDKEVLYFRDFNSGAMIQNIVDRAKKSAIKSVLETGKRGLSVQHLLDAIVDEFAENEDLPNTTNPDDWARISGKKGERIVYIRTLVTGKNQESGRAIDTATNTGHEGGYRFRTGGSGRTTFALPADRSKGGTSASGLLAGNAEASVGQRCASAWEGIFVRFADRRSAGAQLAERLAYCSDQDPVVVGLPRGGVPVAHEVAAALRAPLDVVVVRKLGAPHRPELAAGALGEGGVIVLNDDVVRHLHISQEKLSEIARRERAELERQAELFRRGRPGVDLRDRTVIIIDDGIATGSTTSAAIRVVRALGARRIVLAVPVAPPEVVTALSSQADEVVCLHTPAELFSVGTWYRDFSQVSDDEVSELLGQRELVPRPRGVPGKPSQRANDGGLPPRASTDAEPPPRATDREPSPRVTDAAEGSARARVPAQARSCASAAAGIDEYVEVPVGALRRLPGHLTVPPDAPGVVIFAHGSGSSRHSPRNRSVAAALNSAGLGTLLLDLLDTAEEADRSAVFDIELLADRLAAAADMVRADQRLRNVPVGYFGASTGAAAALSAAAIPGSPVRAIVSRGGRPDLAESRLADVTAPTLLIVGGQDEVVLELNRFAQRRMRCPNDLAVVPGAGHLFTEPGALDRVCELAVDWFTRYLTPAAVPR